MVSEQISCPLRSLITKYGEDKLSGILDNYYDCAGSDQESFLKEKAIMMEKKNICRTYLAMGENDIILGYFSLGLRCMKVPTDFKESKDFTKKMNTDPETNVAQSYLIGQLSRSKESSKGFGTVLLNPAVDLLKQANAVVGCRLVRVDCDDMLTDYYSRHGFRTVSKNNSGNLNQMALILRAE